MSGRDEETNWKPLSEVKPPLPRLLIPRPRPPPVGHSRAQWPDRPHLKHSLLLMAAVRYLLTLSIPFWRIQLTEQKQQSRWVDAPGCFTAGLLAEAKNSSTCGSPPQPISRRRECSQLPGRAPRSPPPPGVRRRSRWRSCLFTGHPGAGGRGTSSRGTPKGSKKQPWSSMLTPDSKFEPRKRTERTTVCTGSRRDRERGAGSSPSCKAGAPFNHSARA